MAFTEPHFSLITYLKSSLTGISVYPSDAPVRAGLPVCVITVVNNEQMQTAQCLPMECVCEVEVWVGASSYKSAWEYARSIQKAIHGYEDSWMLSDGPIDEGVEALDEDGDSRIYAVSLRFTNNYILE